MESLTIDSRKFEQYGEYLVHDSSDMTPDRNAYNRIIVILPDGDMVNLERLRIRTPNREHDVVIKALTNEVESYSETCERLEKDNLKLYEEKQEQAEEFESVTNVEIVRLKGIQKSLQESIDNYVFENTELLNEKNEYLRRMRNYKAQIAELKRNLNPKPDNEAQSIIDCFLKIGFALADTAGGCQAFEKNININTGDNFFCITKADDTDIPRRWTDAVIMGEYKEYGSLIQMHFGVKQRISAFSLYRKLKDSSPFV